MCGVLVLVVVLFGVFYIFFFFIQCFPSFFPKGSIWDLFLYAMDLLLVTGDKVMLTGSVVVLHACQVTVSSVALYRIVLSNSVLNHVCSWCMVKVLQVGFALRDALW